MMKFLRSQSQTVLIVILGVIGIGFLFYGNTGSFLTTGGSAPTDFGRIDGEDLSVADLYSAVHDTRSFMVLQGQENSASSREIAQRAWGDLVLLHEANALHIDVSDQELLAFIQSRPEFQKDGAYSPELYQTAMTYLQNARHISAENYAGLMHDRLRITAVTRTLFSSVRAPASDIAAQFERFYGPAEISYVTLSPSTSAKPAAVSPQEIEAVYKADPMNVAYRTEEKRQVDYVYLQLTPAQIKLPEADRNAAIQALGEKALDFALAFQPDPNATSTTAPAVADFKSEAQKRGLTVATTDFFTTATPPAGMPPSPAFNNEAFALTKESPISKVVQLDHGVVVMRLAQIQPSELKPLAEVSPAIEKQIQQQQTTRLQQLTATISAKALRAAVEKGTPFPVAAAAQHLTVKTLSKFVPLKAEKGDSTKMEIAYLSAQLGEGEISQPIPLGSDGALIVLHVDSRSPADTADRASFETRYRQSEDDQVREMAAQDWVNWKSHQPGTHLPPKLDAYGSVE